MSAVSEKLEQEEATAIVGKQFAAFVCDAETQQAVAACVPAFGWSPDAVHLGGISSAVLSVAASSSPEFLIVDISESASPSDDISALADVCEPGTIVIAIGAVNDVVLYRNLIGAGVQDYIVKPIVPEILRDAISVAKHALDEPLDENGHLPSHHRVVGIMSIRGGLGASTIATSLSWMIANEMDRKTALLDLDVQFGTSALAFDLESGRGLREALENPGRVDGLFIDRASVSYGKNLSILSAEAPLSESIKVDSEAIHHLGSELRKNFEIMLVDIPRGFVTAHPHILQELDELIIVTDLSLAAARDVIRTLAFVKGSSGKTKIRVVANKVESSALNEVSPADFEASIDHKFDWTMPLDRKSLLEATKTGRSLAEASPRCKVADEIRQIARHICDLDDAENSGKTGLFKGLLGGGK